MIKPSHELQTKPEELLLDELDELADELELDELELDELELDELELDELSGPVSTSPPQPDKLRASNSALKCGKLARKSQEVLIIGSLTDSSNDMIEY